MSARGGGKMGRSPSPFFGLFVARVLGMFSVLDHFRFSGSNDDFRLVPALDRISAGYRVRSDYFFAGIFVDGVPFSGIFDRAGDRHVRHTGNAIAHACYILGLTVFGRPRLYRISRSRV